MKRDREAAKSVHGNSALIAHLEAYASSSLLFGFECGQLRLQFLIGRFGHQGNPHSILYCHIVAYKLPPMPEYDSALCPLGILWTDNNVRNCRSTLWDKTEVDGRTREARRKKRRGQRTGNQKPN